MLYPKIQSNSLQVSQLLATSQVTRRTLWQRPLGNCNRLFGKLPFGPQRNMGKEPLETIRMWRINLGYLGLKISGKTPIIHPNSLVRITVLPIKIMHFGGISFFRHTYFPLVGNHYGAYWGCWTTWGIWVVCFNLWSYVFCWKNGTPSPIIRDHQI